MVRKVCGIFVCALAAFGQSLFPDGLARFAGADVSNPDGNGPAYNAPQCLRTRARRGRQGVAAEVTFAGAGVGLVGYMQVNVRVPDSVRAGLVPITLSVGGTPLNQNTITLWVQ